MIDRWTKGTRHSLHWGEPILGEKWRPDGTEVSFFVLRKGESGRLLYIWNLESGKVRKIVTPFTVGEHRIAWAPDGSKLAYSDSRSGLVILDTSGKGVPVEIGSRVATFDWLPGSTRLAFVDDSDLSTVRVCGADGKAIRTYKIPKDLAALELASSAKRDSVLIVTHSVSGVWEIDEVDMKTGLRRPLLSSPNQILSPMWLPNDRQFAFLTDDHGSQRVWVRDRVSGQIEQLVVPRGLNGLRGATPDSTDLFVAHREARPLELYETPVTGGSPSIVYASPSGKLPSVSAEPVWIRSADGAEIPILVWHSPRHQYADPMAIIRSHGGIHGMEFPIWQEDIQLSLRYGIDYIAVNYRGSSGYGMAFERSGSTDERAQDLIAACEYAHKQLGVAYPKIVLLGHSAGAALAAAAGLRAPDRMGLLVLAAFGRVDPPTLRQKTAKPLPQVAIFFPTEDLVPFTLVRRNIQAAFGADAIAARRVRIYALADDHNFHYSSSWAAIYSTIYQYLGVISCR